MQQSFFNNSPNKSDTQTVLKFVKISSRAKTPFKGSKDSAGYDLFSAENTIILARNKGIISTDLKISVPDGTYGRIAPRSGLAANNSIDVGAGVIDKDFRGVVKVILFNHSDFPFNINQGDRIAQLICEKIEYPKILEVESFFEENTERGENGFGSTGKN